MEDFGYQKDGGPSKFNELAKRAFLVIATLFSLAVFIYITVNAYYFVYSDQNTDIETIKSPEEPIKVVEEESQAKESVQIDRSIYEDIFGNKKEKIKTENTKIRKVPEAPIPPKIIEKEQPKITEQKSDQKMIVYSNEQKAEEKKPSRDFLTKMEGEKRDNTAAPTPKVPSKKRAVRVQVAAMTSQNAAEENWKKLNRLHSSLFSGLKPFIEKVDLGKRGIFYRLQIGNFYNQVDAENFCNSYVAQAKKSRADCIVVE